VVLHGARQVTLLCFAQVAQLVHEPLDHEPAVGTVPRGGFELACTGEQLGLGDDRGGQRREGREVIRRPGAGVRVCRTQ